MANSENNIISIPLNGQLNFSKNKTQVTQFNGFNDLNSPIYGGMVSPLYMASRNKNAPGNNRPYLDKDKIIRNGNGQEILDISAYKGIKRTELSDVPERALAVYDNNVYINTERNGETYYTAIHYGDLSKGENKSKTLTYKANAASFTENGLIIINEKRRLHIYDAKTLTEITSINSLDSLAAELTTFYDPLNDWQIINVYEPFGDWDYKKVSKFSAISQSWKDWEKLVSSKEAEIDRLNNEAAASKKKYDDLKGQQDELQEYINNSKKAEDEFYNNMKYWKNQMNIWIWTPLFWKTDEARRNQDYWGDKWSAQMRLTHQLRENLRKWNEANGEALNKAYNEYDQRQSPIRVAETELSNLKKIEPQKYIDTEDSDLTNPNIYAGKVSEAYVFVYDFKTREVVRKIINIPWNELGSGSQGPSGDSYIVTGIYDVYYKKDSSGRWISNTNEDYIRYRLGVVPHGIEMGSNDAQEVRYFFSLSYSPKIHFRNTTAKAEWKISADIPNETLTYICNKRNGLKAEDSEVFFSGTGKGNRAVIWGKVNFEQQDPPELKKAKEELRLAKEDASRLESEKVKKEKEYDLAKKEYDAIPQPTEEDKKKLQKAEDAYKLAADKYVEGKQRVNKAEKAVKELEDAIVDFNNFNIFHDLGYAKYTMYSPWSCKNKSSGNATTNDVEGAREITKVNFNYEVSSDNILYNKPTTNGEYITQKNPQNVFREIINNGIISNVSIAENREYLGTLIETPNTIDPRHPIFYKYGKNGKAIVFKTTQGKWINVEVTDTVEELKLINDDYLVIYTTETANCIRLADKEIVHFAPDWNNRFSLVGSPYAQGIVPLNFPAVNTEKAGVNISDIMIGSGVNVNYEVSQNPIVGYNGEVAHIRSNEGNITPIAFISPYDNIDFYFSDLVRDQTKVVPEYYNTLSAVSLTYGLFNNTDLSGINYPVYQVNITGLFCNIKPSNFGKYYLDEGSKFYSLNTYNGQIFFAYYTSSLLDDIKEMFMVQGQTFAITKLDFLYSVYVDENGSTSLSDAIANVKGLKFCGAMPEMAIFYSPMDRTLKSFTADHMIRDMQQATLISNIYYTTYNPQTSSIYICTSNGVYVYSNNNQYRLPIYAVKEIYFGGNNNEHTYIEHEDSIQGAEGKTTNIVNDYIYDYDFIDGAVSSGVDSKYESVPVEVETRYYGIGNNRITSTDCVYFRLYSDRAPFNTSLYISENSITDSNYVSTEKELKISESDWDKRTKTCYIRYQPKNQRSVGLSVKVRTDCAISEINFSTSVSDTAAISKTRLNC